MKRMSHTSDEHRSPNLSGKKQSLPINTARKRGKRKREEDDSYPIWARLIDSHPPKKGIVWRPEFKVILLYFLKKTNFKLTSAYNY